jgi:hypothetical protein
MADQEQTCCHFAAVSTVDRDWVDQEYVSAGLDIDGFEETYSS